MSRRRREPCRMSRPGKKSSQLRDGRLLQCMSQVLAQMRSAECIEQCPMLRAKRKTYALTLSSSRFDPRRTSSCSPRCFCEELAPASVHRPSVVLTVSIGPKSSRGAIVCSRRVASAQRTTLRATSRPRQLRRGLRLYLALNLNETLWQPRLSPYTRGRLRSDRRGR
jgi:hypothetical protein